MSKLRCIKFLTTVTFFFDAQVASTNHAILSCVISVLRTVWMFSLPQPHWLCHWQMQSRNIYWHIIGLPCLHCIFSQKWIRISPFVTDRNSISNRYIQNHLTSLCCIHNCILTTGPFKHRAITIFNIGFFKYFYSWSPLFIPFLLKWHGF